MSEALKNLDSKKAKKMLSMMSEPMNHLTGLAMALIVILGPFLIAYGSSSFDNDNKRSKFVRSSSLALVGSLVLLVGASHLAKGLYIEQMLKSEKKMKSVVIQAHRKAYEKAVEDLKDQARKAIPLKLNELITNKYQNQSK